MGWSHVDAGVVPTALSTPEGERNDLTPSRRERWDAVALSLPDLSGARSTVCYRRCEQALVDAALGDPRGRRVLKLDLWNEAVNTRLLQWLAARGAQTVGIDISAVTARRARANFERDGLVGRFAQADIRGLPFADASFDFVYTMGTIEHVAEYELAIREVRRVLRPGGRAVIGVPYRWDPFLRPLVSWTLQRLDRYPYSPERSFGGRELRRVVERNGLRVTARTGLMVLPGVLRLADLALHVRRHPFERLIAACVAPFETAELRWPWTRRLAYLVAVVAVRD
jgi:SAM-dependent methyltransferase